MRLLGVDVTRIKALLGLCAELLRAEHSSEVISSAQMKDPVITDHLLLMRPLWSRSVA